MSAKCLHCDLEVRPRQEFVTCFCCSKRQHRTCDTKIDRDQYREMQRAKIPVQFCCAACTDLVPVAESTRLSTGDVTIPYGVTIHEQTAPEADPHTLPNNADQSSFDLPDRHSFSIHPEVQEASLTDGSIDPIPDDTEAVVTFQVVDSGTQRSKRKLVSSDGYTFTCKRQNTASTEWRCSVRNKTVTCPVTVLQKGDNFTVNKTHLHAAQP